MKIAALSVYLVLLVAAIIGWVCNIVALVGMVSGPVNAELIIRIIGVPVAIIGAIMGWM